MIRRMSLITRKAGMSKEAFHRHWEEVHGPLVARLPGLIRYVQHHFDGAEIPAYIRETGIEVDGIAELWFDTLENATLSMDSVNAAQRAAMEDGALMSGGSRSFVVRQVEFAIPEGTVKND